MEEKRTEERIREAARKVFILKGMAGARMQEIADEAGINKALLHYYYRSKEQLFQSVFEEIIKAFMPKLFEVLNSNIPLEVKIYQLADRYIGFLNDHNEMPLFVLNELQRHPEKLIQRLKLGKGIDLSVLARQLKEEAEKGSIRSVSVEAFLLNMISLLVFPFAARQLFQAVTMMDNTTFDAFMEHRKTEVPKYIMNALTP